MSEKNKKLKIEFGAGNATSEEIQEVFPRLKDDRERKLKYLYLVDKIREESKPGFILEWGITNFGFGTTTFVTHNKKLYIDEEAMSYESIESILDKMTEDQLKDSSVNDFINFHNNDKELSNLERLKIILKSHYE